MIQTKFDNNSMETVCEDIVFFGNVYKDAMCNSSVCYLQSEISRLKNLHDILGKMVCGNNREHSL